MSDQTRHSEFARSASWAAISTARVDDAAEGAAPERIVVYTTPTCPDCHALKAWLRRLGLPFDERDLTNGTVADEARNRFGVRIAPITAIGSWFVYGTFQHQKPLIEARIAEVTR
jgi:glutaredoxin